MNQIKLTTLVLGLTLLCLPSIAFTQKVTAEKVLQKVSDRLSNLKTVSYTYQSEYNYASEGYLSKSTANTYIDFTSTDKIVGMRFQLSNDRSFISFNGAEFFQLNKKAKTIDIIRKPSLEKHFLGLSGFQNSPVTLKAALPKIIADQTIPKTLSEKTIDGKKFYVIEFSLDKKVIDAFGDYSPITLERRIIYRLTVDGSDDLPIELFRGNNVNTDFIRMNFEYQDATKDLPTENSWYYSTYQDEYKPPVPTEDKLIKVGQIAPEWNLSLFKDDSSMSLSQHKDKVVMIEFWISFCGYCIAAVPKLNALEEKYKGSGFKLIGINASDTKDIIEKFVKNNQPKYQLLYGGEATANSYGVDRFPIIVLLDKTGKVIYSGVFKPNATEEIETLIDKNLGLAK